MANGNISAEVGAALFNARVQVETDKVRVLEAVESALWHIGEQLEALRRIGETRQRLADPSARWSPRESGHPITVICATCDEKFVCHHRCKESPLSCRCVRHGPCEDLMGWRDEASR